MGCTALVNRWRFVFHRRHLGQLLSTCSFFYVQLGVMVFPAGPLAWQAWGAALGGCPCMQTVFSRSAFTWPCMKDGGTGTIRGGASCFAKGGRRALLLWCFVLCCCSASGPQLCLCSIYSHGAVLDWLCLMLFTQLHVSCSCSHHSYPCLLLFVPNAHVLWRLMFTHSCARMRGGRVSRCLPAGL